ncbi:hypothetical protein [Pseudocitrobacter cyperus]|uniref:Uncharacterized protein n=1 Tax=Pseudocitrobacter cyperus TaxID=3112843 RepID=A0ABV0HN96_9ENTR
MKKRKTAKDKAWTQASLFEKTLVRGYQFAFVIFSLWMGWVIIDEVQMRHDTVSTTVRAYNISWLTGYEASKQGLCHLYGRRANCHDLYTFNVEYWANGRKRTGYFSNVAWSPENRSGICLDYVKREPDIIKLCHSAWFSHHKSYIAFPLTFWVLTLLGAAGIALTVVIDRRQKQKKKTSRPEDTGRQ